MSLAGQLPLLVVAVFLVGTPHGALDGRLARPLLEPRYDAVWLPLFLAAYLAAAGAALLCWMAAPAAALAGFLALAAVHFGQHDSPGGHPVAVLARGALPPVVAAAAHGGELQLIFGWIGGDGAAALVSILDGPLFAVWLCATAFTLFVEPSWPARLELLVLAALFALTPSLIAFSLYFALVHTPRALRSSKRPGESWPALLRAALPFSAAAVALAAVGYGLLLPAIGPEPALVRTVFWWLGALTVPHFILGVISERALRPSPRLRASAPPPLPSRREALMPAE